MSHIIITPKPVFINEFYAPGAGEAAGLIRRGLPV